MTPDDIVRFWSKVDKSGNCWEWRASTNGSGYGKIKLRGKFFYAHRIAWVLTFGDIKPGKCVCHKCDNPICVNPGHLFIGTHRDNMNDMWEKGRGVSGEGSKKAKLNDMQVRVIRKFPVTKGYGRYLAKLFNVHNSTIYRIVRYTRWPYDGV